MATLRMSIAAAFCLALNLQFAGPLSAQVPHEPTQDPLAGFEVFEAKGCIKCHAVNGMGGTVGPDLGRIPRRRSFYELAANMWNHLPQMGEAMERLGIQRPQLNAEEAADLIGFLFTLDYFDAPGDVSAGKHLFTEKKCFACHRVGDYGGEVGPGLDHLGQYGSPILVAAAMWNHSVPMASEMEARNIERPTFEGTELTDLIAYLESAAPQPLQGPLYVLPGRAESGRVIFVEKRCNQCHAVQGVGGQMASDLADQGRQWGLTEFAAAMWNKAPEIAKAAEKAQMPFPQLGAVEMADLVAYLYSIRYFVEPGDPEAGRQRLRDKGCLGCHSLEGAGGNYASDFIEVSGMESPEAAFATLWNHAVLMEAAPEAEGTQWPVLSPEEMADIAAYLQELQESR
jgi:mono/diheme cytochrome c family protein